MVVFCCAPSEATAEWGRVAIQLFGVVSERDRMRSIVGWWLCIVLSPLVLGCSVRSNEGVSPNGLTPMEWASLSKPGPSHKLLEMFAGEWESTISFRSEPGARPDVSKGRSSIRWVLGDRFLQEDFQGEAGGERFQGMGVMGYDNGARQFKFVWIDSLNTAIAVSSGRYVPDRNMFEMKSEVYDPLIGALKTVRSSLQIKNRDEYEFIMVDTAPNGKEFTSLEMKYTRRQ